ncbi:MAG: Bax inhibitor-1/YccA family protein [Acidimicrobiales bacterium]|jgi:uncharacterized YccA/Bax inhibitor family protein|nr:Bax inhibitor-1/YccA family protein [Acidimicrobiales bacterium]
MNPVLTEQRFQAEMPDSRPGWGAPSRQPGLAGLTTAPPPPVAPPVARPGVMTARGAASATLVLLVLLLIAGAFGWSQVTVTTGINEAGETVNTTQFPGWLMLAALGGLVVGLVGAFVPKLAPITGPIYALLYGAAIGGISRVYDVSYDGIVIQAIGASLAVFATMLFLYVTRIIKVTQRLRMVVIGATMGIMLFYLVSWVATLFGADLLFWQEPSLLGIGISVLIVAVAAFNLLLDFDFIERASAAGAPKRMEWYAAFGLLVTLVWLYLEMLRLLALLRER